MPSPICIYMMYIFNCGPASIPARPPGCAQQSHWGGFMGSWLGSPCSKDLWRRVHVNATWHLKQHRHKTGLNVANINNALSFVTNMSKAPSLKSEGSFPLTCRMWPRGSTAAKRAWSSAMITWQAFQSLQILKWISMGPFCVREL